MVEKVAKVSVLVLNCGSSSLKAAVYQCSTDYQIRASFSAERLGTEDGQGRWQYHDQTTEIGGGLNHEQAINHCLELCQQHDLNITAIGHRVVHGGEKFHQSQLIDDSVFEQLQQLNPLAPLHNPVNLLGIEICRKLLPGIDNVAVFDTAFHQSIPETHYRYGVPQQWYEDYGVRRYGFHGSSYRYVTRTATHRLQKELADCHLLIAHLGNGCSACAVSQGKSVDVSMGLTPLEGLVMGTRSGDIDPGLIDHMLRTSDMNFDQIMAALSKESGLLGLSNGYSNDMRTLLEAEANGNQQAQLAIDVFCYRVAKQLAGLSCNLPVMDALIFTGGIGENSSLVRARIVAHWRAIQFRLDDELNNSNGDSSGRISPPGSPLVMVIRTNEEQIIAEDTHRLGLQG